MAEYAKVPNALGHRLYTLNKNRKMKKIYITPSVEIVEINSNEMINSISDAITDNGRGVKYGGVDEVGSLDPDARERILTPDEIEQLENTNEWEHGLW